MRGRGRCVWLALMALGLVALPVWGAAGLAESWRLALEQALGEMRVAARTPGRLLGETGRLGKHVEPVALDVDVSGVRELVLIADDAGDGINGDHCVWASPTLTRPDGSKLSAVKVRVLSSEVQWNHLTLNRNYRGEPLKLCGQVYPEGFWAHANSLIRLDAAGQFARFRALVGTDARADSPESKVHFAVYDGVPLFWTQKRLSVRLSAQFKAYEAALRQDLGGGDGGHAALLGGYERPTAALSRAIRARCGRLGGVEAPYLRRLEALEGAADAALGGYLALYDDLLELEKAHGELTAVMDLLGRTHQWVGRVTDVSAYDARVREAQAFYREHLQRKDVDWLSFMRQVKALRREMLFRHPQLAFRDLLINKVPPPTYSHQCDQYLGRRSRPGAGLVVLRDWKSPRPEAVELLRGKLPAGAVTHPDLSYDGRRILFSYCDHTPSNPNDRRFLIWEIGVDGSGLRQLTGGPQDSLTRSGGRSTVLVEDFDPCYLPDGGIAFVSTRCQSFGRCHGGRYTPAYFLYRMNGDGTGIRPLSHGEANEWDPSVLPDGRLIYTRWDYINRHDTIYQSLWTMRPDGTGTAHFYGNYTRNPCMSAEAMAIPGTNRVVSTSMAHHSYTAGSIVAIDPTKGEDGPEPLTRLTPEACFPETEGWPETPFASPYPVSEDFTFAAVSYERLVSEGRVQSVNAYRIVLIDSLGGREEIYRDPEMSCFSPIPLQARPVPPALCSTLAPAPADGTPDTRPGLVYLQNANLSRTPIRTPVRALRVNSIICQPTARVPSRSVAQNEITKRVEGTVPVSADGSATFTLPSGVPLQLQALDENGMAVMTMRSFIYVQPGEFLSCVGCHENRAQAAPPSGVSLGRPSAIEPQPGVSDVPGGFSFVRSVQPVLDRYCIDCHGFGKATAKLDLRGVIRRRSPAWTDFSESYKALTGRPGLVRLLQRNQETGTSEEKDYFAHAGRLGRMLLAGHCPALKADEASFRVLMTWLDVNVQYFGDYSFSHLEGRGVEPDGERALREAIAARFGKEVAGQPFDTLVNVAAPERSRILLMALPERDGGWGKVKDGAFSGRDDPAWRRLEALVRGSLKTPPPPRPDGTCGLPQCQCGSCWVPGAQGRNRTVASGK